MPDFIPILLCIHILQCVGCRDFIMYKCKYQGNNIILSE